MRTAERSRKRIRSQGAVTSIYLVLVVIPIIGAMIVAWQLSSRLFAESRGAERPVTVAKALPTPLPPPVQQKQAKQEQAPAPAIPSGTGSLASTGSLAVSPPEAARPSEPASTPTTFTPTTEGAASTNRSAAPVPNLFEPDPADASSPGPVASVAPAETQATPESPTAGPSSGKALVDLNSASVEDLNRLGAGRIGRAVVRGRPYASADDLVRKRVLSRSAFARIKDQVGVKRNLAAE